MLGVGEIVAINFCFLQQMSGQGSAWKSSHYWNSSSDQPSSSKLKISTKWEETIAADCRRCHHVLHLKKTAKQNQLNPYHHPQFPPSANVSCLKVITVSGNPFLFLETPKLILICTETWFTNRKVNMARLFLINLNVICSKHSMGWTLLYRFKLNEIDDKTLTVMNMT